jgi:hypothetical protein
MCIIALSGSSVCIQPQHHVSYVLFYTAEHMSVCVSIGCTKCRSDTERTCACYFCVSYSFNGGTECAMAICFGSCFWSHTGLWTALQHAEGALLLLDSAHSDAVLEKHMKVALGSTITSTINGQEAAGRTVLAALASANMLTVRPYSSWCSDIPIAAKMLLNQPSPIVTAPSAVEFFCMRLLRYRV